MRSCLSTCSRSAFITVPAPKMPEHTPTTWEASDLAFRIKAVNHHDELVRELAKALDHLKLHAGGANLEGHALLRRISQC